MKIIGNYTNQEQRDFPLDAEGLATIQDNIVAVELIGRLAGDKAIIAGCESNEAGTRRDSGWVFLKTRLRPDGELMYWEGGTTTAGMYVKSSAIDVQAEGYNYPQAYTQRTLAPGSSPSGEDYKWTDFHPAESTEALKMLIDAQAAAIAKIKPVPAGVIEMYAGAVAPENYLMCEGQAVSKSDYPELYSAIGDTYNTAPLWTGVAASVPAAGYFRVPDLRSRFIVGYNKDDSDYNANGKAGGEKTHALTASEIPSHKHEVNDISGSFNYNDTQDREVTIDGETVRAKVMSVGGDLYTAGTVRSDWHKVGVNVHSTKSSGGSQSHENRPPYYTLYYIIKAK